MEPAGVPTDLAVASTSTKTRRFGLVRSLFEQNTGPDYSLFSCFQFLRRSNYADQMESKAKLLLNNSKEFSEPVTHQKENGDAQLCVMCKKIYLRENVAGVDNSTCPTCYKKEAGEEISSSSNETSKVGAPGGNTGVEAPTNDDIFKHPIQCISCKKVYRTKLKEYMTDEEIFQHECLDCHLKQILLTRRPDSAFHLASSIVEKKIADIKNRMWKSVCEMHSTSGMYFGGEDRKCAASRCKGNSRYRVLCNKCEKSFHPPCVSLPDYQFQFFRCNECIDVSYKFRKNCSSSSTSLEQHAILRKPQRLIYHRYIPEPLVCYKCKTRVYYKFDHLSIKSEPNRYLCLNCVHNTELMA